MTSICWLSCFDIFLEKAFDEDGKLKQPKQLSINKVGHGMSSNGSFFSWVFPVCFCQYCCLSSRSLQFFLLIKFENFEVPFYRHCSITWRSRFPRVLFLKEFFKLALKFRLQKACGHSVYVHFQGTAASLLNFMFSADFSRTMCHISTFKTLMLELHFEHARENLQSRIDSSTCVRDYVADNYLRRLSLVAL